MSLPEIFDEKMAPGLLANIFCVKILDQIINDGVALLVITDAQCSGARDGAAA